MKGYYIGVKNDLLEPKHRKKMGSAVWEFMWLIDKTTSVSEAGIGKILGGKIIKLDEISKEIGGVRSTVSENLRKLEKEKYINITNAPYGLIITVNKSSKVFGKTKLYEDSENTKPRSENQTEDSENTKPTIYNTNTIQETIQLPVWLNKEKWSEWIEQRKQLKKKMTLLTIKKQINFLSQHIKNHITIIDRSILNGWTGLFALPENYKGNSDAEKVLQRRIEDDQGKREREESSEESEVRRKINEDIKKMALDKTLKGRNYTF